MKEPLALTWEEQLRLFENRGMKVSDNDIEKLKNISYYRLKEFARPLSVLDDNGNICYNGIEFKEVLTRYYQDKNLRMYLLHAIEKIEVTTKTKIADVLGNYYGAFGYLDFSRWSNRSKYTALMTLGLTISPAYSSLSENYTISSSSISKKS